MKKEYEAPKAEVVEIIVEEDILTVNPGVSSDL